MSSTKTSTTAMETATAAVKSSHAAATVATAVLGKSRLRQPAQNHESREGANNPQRKFSHFRCPCRGFSLCVNHHHLYTPAF
jgi:hypothetical protein